MPIEQPTSEEIKNHITALFDTVADGYDNPSTRFFSFCADKMIDILQPKQNTHLLDIATGTGAVAISAAQILLPEGQVHGIDLSEKMLDTALKNAEKMELSNIELHVMDAEKPNFSSNYFHNITCSFGLFFIPDMANSLSNWIKILQPEGTVIFSTFAPESFSPLTDLFKDRLAEYGIIIPSASWFRLSEPDDCRQLLEQAGFTNIKIESKQLGYHLLNIDDWWDILWNTGYRAFLNQLSANDLAKFRSEHLHEVEQFKTDEGIWLNIQALFSTGQKPS